jgi:formiminotetrahydrofolate cyclodeaminase
MLADLTIKEFLEKTAGNEPVPGGGSISALHGAIATALGQMVANLTIGRKKYADEEEVMRAIAGTLESIRAHLLEHIDRDSDAYNRVFQAYKLPKESDEQQAARKQAIQEATIEAASVPMKVARMVYSIMPLIEQVAQRGNQNAVTDAAVAMMTARTAILGALLNVRINLSSINDQELVAELSEKVEELEAKAIAIEHKVLSEIRNKL